MLQTATTYYAYSLQLGLTNLTAQYTALALIALLLVPQSTT